MMELAHIPQPTNILVIPEAAELAPRVSTSNVCNAAVFGEDCVAEFLGSGDLLDTDILAVGR